MITIPDSRPISQPASHPVPHPTPHLVQHLAPGSAERRQEPVALSISPFGPPQHTPTADSEHAFRRRLVELGGHARSDEPPRRCFISALVGALRGGNTVDKVLSVASGITADDLLWAYDHLDGLRRTACDALDALFAEPTPLQLDVASSARTLFPRALESLTATAQVNPGRFPAAVRTLETRMNGLALEVEQIEQDMRSGELPARAALGLLDDGRHVGVHHDAAYRPVRVGDITPQRISTLLAESIDVVRR